jgi:hypothetical protein
MNQKATQKMTQLLLTSTFILASATALALNLQKISVNSSNESDGDSIAASSTTDSAPILSSAPSSTPAIISQPTTASYELTCRAKAKEIAAETYRACVTENRNAEIEKLRKDYQERLRSLKQDYEKDIDQLNEKNDRASEKTNKTKALKKNDPRVEPKSEIRTLKQPTLEARASVNRLSTPTHLPVTEIARNQIGRAVLTDDSVMDIPEPIPVERIKK